MAEGGDLPSLKDGSDADFEFTCTPCGEDSIREEAVKYCPECQEYLFTTCTKHHGRQKITRAHKLLDKDDAKMGSLVAKTKCRHHPDRDIEMYCDTHDMVYCVMCIATEHRSCDGVNRIQDEPKSCVNQTEIHRVLDETKIAQEHIATLAIKQKTNLTFLEEQRNDIQEKLEAVETRLMEHIRKSKRETSEKLDKSYAKMKVKLEAEISVSTNMAQNLENTSEQLQSVASLDAEQLFVQMKLLKKTVADANKLRGNSESYCTKSIYFEENTSLITSVMSEAALGQVSAKDESSKPSKPVPYKMKSKKEINVKIASDKTTCVISDVCQLSDGSIVLTDQGNHKVKRLDMNYCMKDHCDLDAAPIGICCIDKNEVAVKMISQEIQFISLVSTLSKTRGITIGRSDYYGIAYFAGELWISTGCGVNVYKPTEMLVKSIENDQNGQSLFKSFTQHMAVSGDNVFVADWSDGAVCLNTDGTVMREVRDERLENTRGVCVSEDGTLFLCGYSSNNIVMFSRDGKCLGELVAAEAGLKNPICLCYDGNKQNIIVTCNNSDTVSVVELGE